MKTKKHTVSKVIWGIVYGILGLSLTFMIVWNVGLAFKWEWCQELTKLFNTDVRQTQYFAATSLLLQVMLIIVALLLVIFFGQFTCGRRQKNAGSFTVPFNIKRKCFTCKS